MTIKKRVTPIFIFSLPRSGSTLLQRLIGEDKAVSYTSEPWVLLPLFYALKNKGINAEYDHQMMFQGINNFAQEIKLNGGDFQQELKVFSEKLYQTASEDQAIYFIDKTPRYHHIVNEIIELFDDAKFIFLWRNPLAIQASCIDTWCSGKWNVHLFKQDQFQGLANLTAAYEKNKDKCWAINYEDLVTNPQEILKPLFEDYLNIKFSPCILRNFNQKPLKKGLGDKAGSHKYSGVTDNSLFKWQKSMSGTLRKKWCSHYINWIGNERLTCMGYDQNKLLKEIKSIPSSYSNILGDLARALYGKITSYFKNFNLSK